MIYLKSIDLTNFKGVTRLSCELDDFTLLAGLNNSGKTTVLQGVYLLFSSLPQIAAHPHIAHANSATRTVSLQPALSPLGLRDSTWLYSTLAPDVVGTVSGTFSNGLRLELGIIRNTPQQVTFTVSHVACNPPTESVREFLAPYSSFSAAILTPPGDVPTRETMLNADQYQDRLRQVQGAQLWRNGIWCAIQADGPEKFAPVQQQIATYFPDVELLLPTLGLSGTPEILIKYRERGKGPLDIAQSGAGLRTFISLARILEQSPAKVILLDEPDSHLHASQQSVIVDLMLDAAASGERQVIIASHSPEVIRRVPPECLRWVDRSSSTASGGYELSTVMENLGVSAETYFSKAGLPDVLVYVEGVDDRPHIEALIKWCRTQSDNELPTTLVVPHRDGRFEGPVLQSIVRFARSLKHQIVVVGIRDLDWYYSELPDEQADLVEGDGWKLLTLPCKEFENLLCDATLLSQAYQSAIAEAELLRIVVEESNDRELVDEWRCQVRYRIRERLSKSLDASTKERDADRLFQSWQNDDATRRRLVAGKGLLRKVRHRIHQQHGKTFYPSRLLQNVRHLTPSLQQIATVIFPDVEKTIFAKSGP